jgi:hypothetical protein
MGFLSALRSPKATIVVQLDKDTFSLREPLTGKVNLSSSEEFDSDEQRIEVWVTEWVKATEQKQQPGQAPGQQRTVPVTAQQTTKLHESKNPIGGRQHFTAGFNNTVPFSIRLPSGIPPTYRSQNVRTSWMLKGVIAVKGRPDVTGYDTEVVITY